MKRKLIPGFALALVTLMATGCGPTTSNEWTYASGLADGELGYVILVGEDGNPEAQDRTKGCIDALNEIASQLYNPATGEKGVTVVEKARATCADASSSWSDVIATQRVENWFTMHDDIDLIISNNDGMAIAAQAVSNVPRYTPIIGFDALSTACDMIIEGTLAGSVSQNGDDQALLVLTVLSKLLNNQAIDATLTYEGKATLNLTGTEGNTVAEHILQTKFSAVTAQNANELKPGQYVTLEDDYNVDGKRVLIVEYSASDNFIRETFHAAFPNYAEQMGYEYTIIQGSDANDATLQEQIRTAITTAESAGQPYDAFAFNMITHQNWRDYVNMADGKPVVFFNRQPMTDAKNTADISGLSNVYYVGSGSTGQGIAQGQILKDYFLKFNASNADGH